LPTEFLPSLHGDIYVLRAKLNGKTITARLFCRDNRSATPEEWLIDGLAKRGIVENGAAHIFHWLLGSVIGVKDFDIDGPQGSCCQW